MKQIFLISILACFVLIASSEKSFKKKLITKEVFNVGFDTCNVCIEFASQALNELLNAILNIGVIGECSNLCSYVEQKTGNKIVGAVCNILCDLVGVKEFVKIIENADLDTIYYCELLKTCKIKDDGDATITSLSITPSRGSQGTTFTALVDYVSYNGTGTGELGIAIKTFDGVDLSDSFLIEAKQPGKYEERINFQAQPDPDCDPTQGPCEEWLPGLYFVEIAICNGECGSHHPHSQVYSQAVSNFTIV